MTREWIANSLSIAIGAEPLPNQFDMYAHGGALAHMGEGEGRVLVMHVRMYQLYRYTHSLGRNTKYTKYLLYRHVPAIYTGTHVMTRVHLLGRYTSPYT